MVDAPVQRFMDFSAKPGIRHAGAAFDQPMIEPGCTARSHLAVKAEVGTSCEDQSWLRLAWAANGPQLDDAAKLRALLKHLDAAKPNVMGTTIDSVDDGVGGAGQLVVQSLIQQPADDWLGWCFPGDCVAVEG